MQLPLQRRATAQDASTTCAASSSAAAGPCSLNEDTYPANSYVSRLLRARYLIARHLDRSLGRLHVMRDECDSDLIVPAVLGIEPVVQVGDVEGEPHSAVFVVRIARFLDAEEGGHPDVLCLIGSRFTVGHVQVHPVGDASRCGSRHVLKTQVGAGTWTGRSPDWTLGCRDAE